MRIVALIPARAGSKRIVGKNTRLLGGKPLIQWTIEAAKESGIFSAIVTCTDSLDIASLADSLGATHANVQGPPSHVDSCCDITWVADTLPRLSCEPDAFAILRPTTPFRPPGMIRGAWEWFLASQPCDSLRALEEWTGPHPGKMWTVEDGFMYPALKGRTEHAQYHSSPTQLLPPVYRQNASLEIAWVKTVVESNSIAGDWIVPYLTGDLLDLNTEDDWERAERHVAALQAQAPAQ
jgi:CMP-N-acetylneuraminic acid synthetase